MKTYEIDWEQYAAIARRAGAEGIVLLRNEKNTLPLAKGHKISLFGRIQLDYIKSGTGSGGMVNTRYTVGILDAFKASGHVSLNYELLRVYEDWAQQNPFDKGTGWGGEPWCQVEMPVSDELAESASKASDAAVVIIGRTAGEDRDNSNTKGSYLLSDEEERMLETVCRHFERVTVVLNVGNIIDMKWVERYQPSAVVYSWQGGQEGGNAVLDVLTGAVCPSGRLTDTIAYDIADYPSTANYGGENQNYYEEDIYVGYRYFETAAKDRVLYPFGFGLSYTSFETIIKCFAFEGLSSGADAAKAELRVCVKNTGAVSGKEVVQVYFSAPQGKLGKPARELIGFAKTRELEPEACEDIYLAIPIAAMASYDDSGVTGHKSCYVLEPGRYEIFIGANVRDAESAGHLEIPELIVTKQLTEALSPVCALERMKPEARGGGYVMNTEPAPLRSYNLNKRIDRPTGRPCTGDKGYKLVDVFDGAVAMETFLDQLSDAELICLMRGEGMSSPKVTPGTGAAFGGVTNALSGFGIPVGCCSDGPSGIRMDSGGLAFSLPSGTALACSFNTELVTELFDMVGKELRKNRVDLLLGPGMNIRRNPLNGRNFEYFSEDPYVTGKMAAAQLKGLHNWEVSGTIKHFACNNQEFRRYYINSIVSERAIREIYLKGYEIAVKEGKAVSIMTQYGGVNGLWAAGNYDLLTTILRGEWGFQGFVMTDWWSKINDEGEDAVETNLTAMARAQNDVYMVVRDSLTHQDNLAEGLKSGAVTRGELLRNAANICGVLMKLAVMRRYLGRISDEEKEYAGKVEKEDCVAFDITYLDIGKNQDVVFNAASIDTSAGSAFLFGLAFQDEGNYQVSLRYRINADEMAQIPFSLTVGSSQAKTVVFNGTNNEWALYEDELSVYPAFSRYMKLYFSVSGLEIDAFTIKYKD